MEGLGGFMEHWQPSDIVVIVQARRICPLKNHINFWNHLTFFIKHLILLRSLKEPFHENCVKIFYCWAFSLSETIPGCQAFSHCICWLLSCYFSFEFLYKQQTDQLLGSHIAWKHSRENGNLTHGICFWVTWKERGIFESSGQSIGFSYPNDLCKEDLTA